MQESMPPPEPAEIVPPELGPPSKLEFEALVYGWMKHVHLEIEDLLEIARDPDHDEEDVIEKLGHIHGTFDEALRELDLRIPEETRNLVTSRAASRKKTMEAHPLPPFPEYPEDTPGSTEEHGFLS